MLEIGMKYRLSVHLKGWPVKEAGSIEEASHLILGSPYWEIPKDIYIIIDKNETYSLLAVYCNGHPSRESRYLAINMALEEKIDPISESYEIES